ncbi:MAG: oxidoreductase, partial [Actinomycetia bacterium]|nr:oxidoreductase [Actinomycetes bacterium]
MDQNLCTEEGIITEDVIAHYEDRAAGGAAALILETSAVAYPVGATSRVQPSLSTDDCIPGLRELADRVHAKGAKLLVQMCHHGKTASVDIVEGREMLVPSLPMPDMNLAGMATDLTMPEIEKLIGRLGGMQPLYTQATTDDLAWVVAQFVEAAKRVQQAGCDGVEIHAAHGYLISSFLSPCWNRRDDEYGGDVEGRARLLAEIVEAVKAATSDQFALIVRIDGSEFRTPIPGITPALAAQHA